jgi:hypothetical protein
VDAGVRLADHRGQRIGDVAGGITRPTITGKRLLWSTLISWIAWSPEESAVTVHIRGSIDCGSAHFSTTMEKWVVFKNPGLMNDAEQLDLVLCGDAV